jgi:hypothetical protein
MQAALLAKTLNDVVSGTRGHDRNGQEADADNPGGKKPFRCRPG